MRTESIIEVGSGRASSEFVDSFVLPLLASSKEDGGSAKRTFGSFTVDDTRTADSMSTRESLVSVMKAFGADITITTGSKRLTGRHTKCERGGKMIYEQQQVSLLISHVNPSKMAPLFSRIASAATDSGALQEGQGTASSSLLTSSTSIMLSRLVRSVCLYCNRQCIQ